MTYKTPDQNEVTCQYADRSLSTKKKQLPGAAPPGPPEQEGDSRLPGQRVTRALQVGSADAKRPDTRQQKGDQ